MNERIGVIGLGRMGRALALRLAGQGFAVTGWTRSGAAPEGIAVAGTLDAAVAASDILLLSLFDDAAVRGVLASLAACDLAGRLVVETSTVSPAVVREAAPAIEAAGGRILDAPISGGPEMVAAGTIGMFLGGAPADIARLDPLARRLSDRILPVGALGAGHAAKIVNNVALGGMWQTTLEALRLGQRLGLGRDTMLGVLERSPGTGPALRGRLPKIRGEDMTVGFSVAGILKDQDLFLAVAEAVGEPLPALAAARENFRAAASAGHGEEDLARMIAVRLSAP